MMLFRTVKAGDLNAIHQLALQSGVGLTTLPKDLAQLSNRINWSEQSFAKKSGFPNNEYYLFVLEDCSTGLIVGTAAIESMLGTAAPFYSYKVSNHTQVCHSLNIRYDYQKLNLVNDLHGKSELCTLFLAPEYRVNGNGLLLSRARFLFMKQFVERFAATVIAEMRGVSNDNGESPLWQNIGEQFFKTSFQEADKLTLTTNKQFIADLMPKEPIHVQLLSNSAQQAIGKPHSSTVPAMKILLQEGFRFNNYVDIFDGGPTLEAEQSTIATIQNSKTVIIGKISEHSGSTRYLIANSSIAFRATIGTLTMDGSSVCLSADCSKRLNVCVGDYVHIVQF